MVTFLFLASDYCSLNECLIPQCNIGYNIFSDAASGNKNYLQFSLLTCILFPLLYTLCHLFTLLFSVMQDIYFPLVYHNLKNTFTKRSRSCSWSIVFIWKEKIRRKKQTGYLRMRSMPHFGELQPVHYHCKYVPLFPFNFVSKTVVTKNSIVMLQNDHWRPGLKSKPGHRICRSW